MTALAGDVAAALIRRNHKLITAESCTGGLVASRLTALPGSSRWFEGAFVTYQPRTKIRMLGVSAETIDRYGVVSEPVAREMAVGALVNSEATVSVAITGVAGPGGGDVITPVGTVWFAWAIREDEPRCLQASARNIDGDREVVRERAVTIALEGVLALLAD